MFNKLILRVFLALSLTFTGAASATLITQNIYSDVDGLIGSISINIDNATEWDIGDSYVNNFVQFEFFGFEMLDLTDFSLDNPLFEAHFNPDDLYAGIQSLDFDLYDIYGAYAWNGFIEAGFGGYVDVFTSAAQLAYFAQDVSFGQASVVPEPSALILLLTGLIAFAARRKVGK